MPEDYTIQTHLAESLRDLNNLHEYHSRLSRFINDLDALFQKLPEDCPVGIKAGELLDAIDENPYYLTELSDRPW